MGAWQMQSLLACAGEAKTKSSNSSFELLRINYFIAIFLFGQSDSIPLVKDFVKFTQFSALN